MGIRGEHAENHQKMSYNKQNLQLNIIYLKMVYKMIPKSEFLYCHTYEFDFSGVVEG